MVLFPPLLCFFAFFSLPVPILSYSLPRSARVFYHGIISCKRKNKRKKKKRAEKTREHRSRPGNFQDDKPMNLGEGGNLYLPCPPHTCVWEKVGFAFLSLLHRKESLYVNDNHLPPPTNGSQASRDPGFRGVEELRGAWLFFSPMYCVRDSSVLSPLLRRLPT
ncbi:uncharacterized protein LY79DRAFT_570764 [Colletotrichum navitas]|uniref:Secreted protein n=1 Tax=Colletotrichum navitas TaxID=681940 RepID=A0AAD8PLL7_9PEZI|nr:uncharacterized protein LY79DRAFT_570764 [Colletotrichum navitas]KAK1569983.1 hypothetical protein LY79DRAFT_570764 [Colletotrichum navitas]